MKITPSSSRPAPRLSCRVVRLWSALTDSATPGHAASCSECREYFRTAHALEHALRREATPTTPASPGREENQIRETLRAVRNAAPAPAEPHHWRRALATGVATAALAVVMVHFNRGPIGSPSVTENTFTPAADAALLADTVKDLSSEFVDEVIPSAGALVANNPLQREFDSIYADARSALGFLALNFLPVLPESSPATAPAKSQI